MFKSSVVSLLVPHICYIALHHILHENINRCYKKVKSKVRANSVSVAHPSSANSEMPRIVNYFQRSSVLSFPLYVFHLIFFCSTSAVQCLLPASIIYSSSSISSFSRLWSGSGADPSVRQARLWYRLDTSLIHHG